MKCGWKAAGVGSTFHFTIQIKLLADGAPDPFNITCPYLAGRRVLILEDKDTNRRILTRWLEKFGMQVTAVPTVQKALEQLQQKNAFDAAILDFQFPDMDGLSLVAAMRELPGGELLSLLPLTSVHLRANDPRAANLRVSAPIHRPIRPKQLLDALSQTFDRAMTTSVRKAPLMPTFDRSFSSRLPLRILMADDDRVNQKVGSIFLERFGYRAEVVGNGLEVL